MKEKSTDGLEKIMNSTVFQYSNKQICDMQRTNTRSESYIPTNALLYAIKYQSKMLILKHLRTLQHVSITIQIIFRELVGSLLKSLNLKVFKIVKLDCGDVAA